MTAQLPTLPVISTRATPAEIKRAFDQLRTYFAALQKDGGNTDGSTTTTYTNTTTEGGDTVTVIPDVATGLVATGAFNLILISWDTPSYTGHAYTEVWRADVDNLAVSVLIGSTPAAIYPDTPPDSRLSADYYYWVRNVSTSGDKSAFNATSGVLGSTADEPGYLIDLLSGRITEGFLYQDLNDRIDLIDTPTTGIVDRLLAISSQIEALAGEVVGTVFIQASEPVPGVNGVPDPIQENSRWYDSDDNNHPYLWTDTGSGYEWTDLSDPRIAENASSILLLLASMEATEDATAANASAITATNATVVNLSGEVTAISDEVTQLSADIDSVEGDIQGNSEATTALTARVTTNEGDIASNASSITQLSTDLVAAEQNITANSEATTTLTSRVEANEDEISSQAESLIILSVDISDANADILANSSAVSSLSVRVTDTESDITSLATSLGLLSSTVGENTALIQTEETTRASADSALSSSVTTIQARLDTGDYAAVKVEASANTSSIGVIEGKYTVKIDVNGYVAGYGLIATNNNGVPTSEFGVSADKFWIGSPEGNAILPFMVYGGVCYLDVASIRDATITNAKIQSIAADKITTGYLSANRIEVGSVHANRIESFSIQAAQIAAYTIVGNRIAAETITADKIVANSLTANEIAALTITADKIAANSIITEKINGHAVTEFNAAAALATLSINAVIGGYITVQLSSVLLGYEFGETGKSETFTINIYLSTGALLRTVIARTVGNLPIFVPIIYTAPSTGAYSFYATITSNNGGSHSYDYFEISSFKR